MQNRLKVGIAGYGIVGERRRLHIDRNPYLETIAVCDQKFSSGQVTGDGVRMYSHYEQLLEEPLDLLFVCLPNYIAPEVTIAGLRKGMHVFCEKPPGCTVSDVEEVMSVKDRHPDLKLKYGFNHRYHDSVRDALQLISSKELGDIICIRGVYGKSVLVPFKGNWRSEKKLAGGGILLDQGIHMVDLIRLFCDKIVNINSVVSNSYWNCDVEDNAYALMRDEKGRVVMLHSSATQWQHRFSMEVAFTEGYIELKGILSGSKSYGAERLIVGRRSKLSTGADREETITYLEDNSWRDEIDEFADSIVSGTPIINGTVEDALETMKLVFRIYEADPQWSKKI